MIKDYLQLWRRKKDTKKHKKTIKKGSVNLGICLNCENQLKMKKR